MLCPALDVLLLLMWRIQPPVPLPASFSGVRLMAPWSGPLLERVPKPKALDSALLLDGRLCAGLLAAMRAGLRRGDASMVMVVAVTRLPGRSPLSGPGL